MLNFRLILNFSTPMKRETTLRTLETEQKDNLLSMKKKENSQITEQFFFIGQESNNKLLILRYIQDDESSPTTIIDLVDLTTKTRKTLFSKKPIMSIVGASLSIDSSFLLITMKFTHQIKHSKQILLDKPKYQIFLVELKNNSQFREITKLSYQYQRAFFISKKDESKKQTILVIIDQKIVQVIQIGMKSETKKGNNIKLITKIKNTETICEEFLWYQWNPQHEQLFLLKQGKSADKNELICYSFHHKQTKVILTTEFEIIENNIESKMNKFDYFHDNNMHGLYPPSLSFQFYIAKISRGNFCLCRQQITTQDQKKFLQISIWILYRRERIDVSIPIKDVSKAENAHVIFSSIYELLIIYVPGMCLEFFDCTILHDPIKPVHFEEEEYVTSFFDSASYLCPIELHKKKTYIPNENFVINNLNGKLYSFNIALGVLKHVFLQRNSELSSFIAHICFTHFNNPKFADALFDLICKAEPTCITPKLVQEYLIASTFQILFIKQNMPSKLIEHRKLFLSTIPMTQSKPFKNSLTFISQENCAKDIQIQTHNFQDKNPISYVNYQRIDFSKLLEELTKNEIQKEFPEEENEIDEERTQTAGIFSASQLKQIFKNRFLESIEKTTKNKKQIAEELTTLYYKTISMQIEKIFHFVVVNLIQEFSNLVITPSENKMLQFSSRRNQDINSKINSECQNQDLKNTILAQLRLKQRQVFDVLEKFYMALEEFSLPFPNHFHYYFCRLGFSCLPRELFLQHLDRNIFRVDSGFISDLIKPKRKNDTELLNSTVEKLQKTEDIIKILIKYKDSQNIRNLIEFYSREISHDYISLIESQNHKLSNSDLFHLQTEKIEDIEFSPLEIAIERIEKINNENLFSPIIFISENYKQSYDFHVGFLENEMNNQNNQQNEFNNQDL
ncbi:gamma-secretase-activating protein [Anaeramoeba ignava]|uniref:Gamma-secretase-activating protein n=1 Tax=Anaeramoeba ignava TaxID=1746090 RepID=A0A9Q0LRB2_ANAIG|nr:gamma-secretase-activating protein [Anaeramoeba ignava]